MRLTELITEAQKFDIEFADLQARQLQERAIFVQTRIPKAGHVLFDDEAYPFVMAGGSLAYLVGRREMKLNAGNAST